MIKMNLRSLSLQRYRTVCRPLAARSLSSVASASTNSEEHFDLQRNDTNKHYPHLFTPIELNNGIVLPNRVLMGSMHTGLEGHSIPSLLLPFLGGHEEDLSAMAKYFQERAKGGVGLMVTGGIAPNRAGWVGPFAAQLTCDAEMELHKQVTQAVHAIPIPLEGGASLPPKICLQILHSGRYGYHPLAVSASATKSPISPFKAKELSVNGIQQTISDFVRCATLAQQAGYDGVEIMGSEGYLISQFLCTRTNLRTDDYGGSFANRSKFPLEIIQQTRAAVGPDFILIFRLSLLDLVEQGMSWDECLELAQAVEQAGANIINTGIGWHEARVPTIATSVPRAAFCRPTHLLKEANVVDLPIVATNRINSPSVAEDLLQGGMADMVSMARPFLADPELLNKAREGRAQEINTCIACNQACLDHAFVAKTASCLVNARACQETNIEIKELAPNQRLRLGVVGAGPAGCAFALTAAQMGHDVTLYDRADEIGGQFNMAKRVPGKEEFHDTIRYFNVMLDKHGVQRKLNTEIGFVDMEKEKDIDKWIVATGVDPRDPKIPGMDHENVLSYIDVLRHNAPVGKRVAIIGAGGIGFDVAEFLLHYEGTDKTPDKVDMEDFWAEWGVDPNNEHRGGLVPPVREGPPTQRKLVLLQRKKGKVGATLGKTTGWIHRATLNHSNAVEMVKGVTYEKIDHVGHLHIIDGNGKKRVLEVDNIVVCAGQVEQHDLEINAKDHKTLEDRVFTIGGAFEAGELDAKRAIDMGTRLAVRIHDDSVVPGKHKFEAPISTEETLSKMLQRWMK